MTHCDPCNGHPKSVYTAHTATVAREQHTERARRSSSRDKVLTALKTGPKTNVELNAICYRYGGRIHELRREGHVILSDRMVNGLWLFSLCKEGARV